MLLLLFLCVAALSHTAGAAITSEQHNITDCPITVYGQQYTTVYVSEKEDSLLWCFDGFKGSAPGVCLHTQSLGVGSVSLSLTQDAVEPTSDLYPTLPGIQGSSPCSVHFQVLNETNNIMFSLLLRVYGETFGVVTVEPSGSQSRELYLEVSPEKSPVDLMNITSGESELSLSGCRDQDKGVVLRRDSKACLSDGSVGICSEASVLSSEPCNHCHNGECLLGLWCAVTGSSVADISGALSSIPDRCGYSLLSRDDVNLSAVFRERRRRDVSLLDHLLLTVGSTNIYIGPGGFKLDGALLDISNISSAQMPEGITISKTSTELSLIYSQHFSLTFHGDSALIFFRGLDVSAASGLCISASTDLSTAKASELSPDGCDVTHSDAEDSTIDCPTATTHCSLLNSSLFAPCHSHIDPAPFISSCSQTLCSYPSEDGLQCSFHHTYHSLCSQAQVTLPKWTTQAQCENDGGRCLDTYCSEHEFCGVYLNKEVCLCRAVFAHKYKSNKTFGEPTVCGDSSASVYLVGCLLNERGIKHSELHLNDPSCRGLMDPVTHMIQFQFDSGHTCGTQVLNQNSQMTFRNSIRMKNQSGMVTRHDQFTVDFSCFYSQPELKTVALRIRDSSVVQRIVSGAWSYNLTMKAYLDSTRTQPIDRSTELTLDQTIWVQLSTAGLDHNLVSVVTDSCWATSHPQPNSTPRYDLLLHGCANPQDRSVKVVGNGADISNFFSFNMFQFSGSSDVFLHCRLLLCSHQNTSCLPSCGSRRRRSVIVDPNPALITLSWAD